MPGPTSCLLLTAKFPTTHLPKRVPVYTWNRAFCPSSISKFTVRTTLSEQNPMPHRPLLAVATKQHPIIELLPNLPLPRTPTVRRSTPRPEAVKRLESRRRPTYIRLLPVTSIIPVPLLLAPHTTTPRLLTTLLAQKRYAFLQGPHTPLMITPLFELLILNRRGMWRQRLPTLPRSRIDTRSPFLKAWKSTLRLKPGGATGVPLRTYGLLKALSLEQIMFRAQLRKT